MLCTVCLSVVFILGGAPPPPPPPPPMGGVKKYSPSPSTSPSSAPEQPKQQPKPQAPSMAGPFGFNPGAVKLKKTGSRFASSLNRGDSSPTAGSPAESVRSGSIGRPSPSVAKKPDRANSLSRNRENSLSQAAPPPTTPPPMGAPAPPPAPGPPMGGAAPPPPPPGGPGGAPPPPPPPPPMGGVKSKSLNYTKSIM